MNSRTEKRAECTSKNRMFVATASGLIDTSGIWASQLRETPSIRVIVRQAANIVIKCIQSCSCQDTGLAHGAPIHPAVPSQAVH